MPRRRITPSTRSWSRPKSCSPSRPASRATSTSSIPAVITIAHIEAGTTSNIIPDSARLEGTFRAVSERTRESIQDLITRVVDGVCLAHGAIGEVEIEPGYPVTVNDPDVTADVRRIATQLLGPDAVIDLAAPVMGAEDFSYVLQRVPGMMAYLGARPDGADPATYPDNHSDLVVFDEPAMAAGMAMYAAYALQRA